MGWGKAYNYSTDSLWDHFGVSCFFFLQCWGSNPGLSACSASALPLSPQPLEYFIFHTKNCLTLDLVFLKKILKFLFV